MADKPEQPIRVMDVTHPRNVQPPTTSKPVIVSNRPMIAADPMIAGMPAKPAKEDVELPAGAPEPTVPPEAVTQNHESKTILPTEDLLKAMEQPKPAEKAEVQPADVPAEEPAKTGEPIPTAAEPPAKTQDTPTQPEEVPAIETDDEETEEEDEDTPKPETAEQKRERELETIIASGKYYVPINRSGKKRAMIVFVVILCLIGLLAVADLLLDMGIVRVSGIPHTSFFSI